MRSSRDPAGDPERRLAATASGSRERRREATGVPKQPATVTSYGTSPVDKVMSVLTRIAQIIQPLSRMFTI